MRIANAEVIHLRAPLAVPVGPAGARNQRRETLLLRLETTDGTVGWGETYAVGGAREQLTGLSAQLVGARLDRPAPLPVGLDEDGASFALGAIDIAWHDLLGRSLGIPVHVLLGGAVRERVRAYASGFLYQDGVSPRDAWPTEAATTLAAGFRSLKLRIGERPPDEELTALADLVETLPAGASVMVDAWGAYSLPTALAVGRRLGELGVTWFEEPTHVSTPELASRLEIAVAGGELGRTRSDFERMLTRHEVDIVQPDVAICGGLKVGRFVGELAATLGLQCVPHSWNGPVMAAATLHLAAVLPASARTGDADHGPLLEVDTSPNPLMRELAAPLSPVDGWLSVPDSPGLGVTLDESALSAFRVK